MNRSLRSIAFPAGIALVISSAACSSDVKPVGDVLATDSTLALEVLGANQDTTAIAEAGDSALQSESGAAAESAAPVVAPTQTESSREAAAITQPTRTSRARAARSTERSTRLATRSRSAPSTSSRRTARRTGTRGQRRTATRTRDDASIRIGSSAASTSRTGDARISTTIPSATVGTPSSASSRAWLVIPAGSEIELEAAQRVCASTAMAGDLFSATITEPLVRANATLIPEGASARAEVVSTGTSAGSGIEMRIASILVDGRTYPVNSRVTSSGVKRVRARSGSGSAARVAAGAAAGAVIGQVLGGDAKSTVIGAAGGAITGGVIASRTGAIDQCLPNGGRITAELTEPLRIQLSE